MSRGIRVIVVNTDEEAAPDLRGVLLSIEGVRIVAEIDEPALLAQALGQLPAEVLLVHLDPNPAGMMDVVAPLIEAHKGQFASIAMTENRDAELVMRAMRAGMKEFLWKPFPPEQLAEILQRVATEATGGGRRLGRLVSVVGLTQHTIRRMLPLKGVPDMALVVLPEGQQRSGKQGGMVWSHNAAGPYTRNRAIPTNPNTDRQVQVRNAVRALAIRWETILTQGQRDAWDTYAANVSWQNRLGQTITLTGLNHYIRSNTLLQMWSITLQDAAPVIFDIAAAEASLSVAASEATQVYTLSFDDTAPWCSEDDAYQFFFAGLPQNGSRKFFGSPWRWLHNISGDSGAPPVSPVAVAAGNTPWPIAQGQRLWVRSRILRADGRLSEFAQVNFLCGA